MSPETMSDLGYLMAILAITFFILALGGVIADYIFPHIRPLQRYLDSLPDYDEDEEKVIDFPGPKWGVWAVRSSSSIFGPDENWVAVRGSLLTFPTRREAAAVADEYNEMVGTENLWYAPRAM